MLAMSTLSAGWSAVFFGIALAVFVVGAVVAVPRTRPSPPAAWWSTLIGIGLGAWVFVSFWNAVAIATR